MSSKRFKITNEIDCVKVEITSTDGATGSVMMNPDTVLKYLIDYYLEQEALPRMFRAIGNHIQLKGVYGYEQNLIKEEVEADAIV